MSARGGRIEGGHGPTWTLSSGLALLAVLSIIPGCPTDPGGTPDAGTRVCRSDRDCSTAGLVCDRSIGECVECVTGADCAGGEACRGGVCEVVTPCTSSRMCPGLVCDTGRGYCVECITDTDCGGGQICRDGDCVDPPRPCDSDRDCTDLGLVCGTSVGHCVECIGDPDCATDRYCGSDFTCAPDACAASSTMCSSATALATCVPNGSGYGPAVECGAEMACVGSACVSTAMDAGSDSDAGSDPDAGTPVDAGTADGGADAGTVDSGTDAGPPPRFALAFDGGLDGTPDEVEFPMSLGFAGTRFTFEAWVRPTTTTALGSVAGGAVFMHRADCRDFWLDYSWADDGRFGWRVYPASGCGSQTQLNAATPSALGAWHHVAGVFEDGAMRLYVNGILEASGTQPGAISWTTGLLGHWAGRDGADSRPTRGGFIGEIDEIRVSGIARYSGASFVPPAHLDPDADTVAAWLFDEGAGTVTADASPSALDGTITGARWVASTR